MDKAVLTVVGKDKVGIIAAVSNALAEKNVNILDLSQTIMENIFTMIVLVDVASATEPFHKLAEEMKLLGDSMQLKIQLQHESIFDSMHQI
ncbi:MAG: ACT domain-containing protein [Ruminococcaceae bacterium]|nr:ACT domain-containing protein [Oscillospiraceae bacterium]